MMETEQLQNSINSLLEKLNSRKKFYRAESEGFGPCCILLLSQVKLYDEIINEISRLKDGAMTTGAVIELVNVFKEKIRHCRESDTYEMDKIMIKTYEEIILELEALV